MGFHQRRYGLRDDWPPARHAVPWCLKAQAACGSLNTLTESTRRRAEACSDSVSTFCVLGRHGLRLGGFDAPYTKHAIVTSFRESFAVAGQAFDTLLGLREGNVKPRDVEPVELFQNYLEEIAALIAAIDRLEN